MYQALIDTHSLKDPTKLKSLQVVGEYDEQWPGEEFPILHIVKVVMPDNECEALIADLRNEWLDDGWYAVLWNETTVFIVFANQVFMLRNSKPWIESEMQAVIDYGAEHEVVGKYFLNIRKAMNNF